MKIQDIQTALKIFQDAAKQHGIATESGNYQVANKNYENLLQAINFIKTENDFDKLLPLVNSESIGVQLWAATYLLPVNEKVGIRTFREIMKKGGVHSLTAETTLTEWKNGNLKLFPSS